MAKIPPPYNGCCPSCGHTFTLATLKEMATGDGWVRYVPIRARDGDLEWVSFDDFNPATMTALTESYGASSEEHDRLAT